MNYLLDTHILLWTLISPQKLSAHAKNILLDPEQKIYISSVSLWEIALKYRIGKLKLKGKKPDEIPQVAKSLGFSFLNLNENTAATFYKIPIVAEKDPFDLMIAWQAIKQDLILLSKDKGFDDYKKDGLRRVW